MITKLNASQRRIAGHGTFQIALTFPGIGANPAVDTGLLTVGRFDHARLKPGAFIGMHPHRNDEILSLLRTGTMLHKDSTGQVVAVQPGNLMMMNAGSGIYHEESIPADQYTDEVNMLQIFIRPQTEDLPPRVQFAHLEPNQPNQWRLVGAPEAAQPPLIVRSSTYVYDLELRNGSAGLPPAEFDKPVYLVYVFAGSVQAGSYSAIEGDSLIIENENVSLHTVSEATVVAFVMDKEATYTRKGMYSGG